MRKILGVNQGGAEREILPQMAVNRPVFFFLTAERENRDIHSITQEERM